MTNSNQREFVGHTLKLLGNYAKKYTGDVLYSDLKTLQKGDFYFLGVNPGGKSGEGKKIEETLSCTNEGSKNFYVDDCSNGQQVAGATRLQKNAKALFRAIFKELASPKTPPADRDDVIREVLCTNLIFRNTKGEKEIAPSDVCSCWGVHEYLLNIVQPKWIIAYGKRPYTEISNRLGLHDFVDPADADHGTWKFRAARKGGTAGDSWKENVVLIGIPHLSRYSFWNSEDKRQSDRLHALLTYIRTLPWH